MEYPKGALLAGLKIHLLNLWFRPRVGGERIRKIFKNICTKKKDHFNLSVKLICAKQITMKITFRDMYNASELQNSIFVLNMCCSSEN